MDTFEVRDNRRSTFFWVNNYVFDEFAVKLGAIPFAVYCALARHANNDSRACFPSRLRLATMLDISESSIDRAVKKLEELKLVHVERRKKGKENLPNVYTLVDPSREGGGFSQNPPGVTDTPGVDSVGSSNNTKNNKTKTQECDFLKAVEAIRELHPRSDAPVADRKAIKSACSRLMKEKEFTQRDAMIVLYLATKAYASERLNENAQFTKTCAAWFNGACYEKYTERKPQSVAQPSGPDGLAEMRARRAAKGVALAQAAQA